MGSRGAFGNVSFRVTGKLPLMQKTTRETMKMSTMTMPIPTNVTAHIGSNPPELLEVDEPVETDELLLLLPPPPLPTLPLPLPKLALPLPKLVLPPPKLALLPPKLLLLPP